VRVVKSRRMRWAGRVGGRGVVYTGCWWVSQRERDHWGAPDVDGTIILKWIFRNLEVCVGPGCTGLRIGQVAGTCEYGK
jgi:hypothetical protein